MSCKDYEEMISIALDGELSSSDADRLQLHLVGCQHCHEFLNSLQKIKGLFQLQPDTILSKDFDHKFFARLAELRQARQRQMSTQSWWRRKFLVPAPIAYAVALALIFFMGLAFHKKIPFRTVPSKEAYTQKYVDAPYEKIRKIKITKDDIFSIYGEKRF
ncbi:MAG: zf-HC2 domain-containing protein [candidate division KSB1 bacterium]|nr:zf-HC2 domain-containing protein [candidate division KSB1 bacterium]